MSTLRAWRIADVEGAGAGLASVNRAFDEAVVAVKKHMDDALSQWSGNAAAAASARALANRLGGTHITAAVLACTSAIDRTAATLGAAAETALRIADDAVYAGFRVEDTGAVTAPAFRSGNPLLDALFQSQLDERAGVHQAHLTAALETVGALDDDCAARMSVAVADLEKVLRAPEADTTAEPVRAILEGHAFLPDDPKALAAWWSRLGASDKDALFAYDPTVGSRDGLPAHDRDLYNRRYLRVLAERTADDATHAAGYRALTEQLDVRDVPRYLLTLDDRGRAAVALHNPDTADNVATFVPGTGASTARIGADVSRSRAMLDAAQDADPAATTSVITWYGYDAPQTVVPDAAVDRFAHVGGEQLDRFLDGLRAARPGMPSHTVVVGHSYGSTVIGSAAGSDGLAADDLVFVGSPGVEASNVQQLRLDGVAAGEMGQHVYATASPVDPVPMIADVVGDLAHGHNPARGFFGATVFDAPPGSHSAYWDRGNPALARMGDIIAGDRP